ncbi:hypothetical protein BC936DRAFT_141268 [Jimgerdemannia flammicorona]|uniref:ubiquitinyl hydrolase 1 n=1 Tax=Jimgerdemannia flammicorona TaxID=994334 RepID=A0A433A2L0_9FUNG|nr:hypothetical protein BC936DRAFT_141268 [Jimgerdemannia flammicorona]
MQPTTLYHPKYGCNFGDLGRDEINKVMAGISWSLPTTPPFDTGLVKTPRQSSKTPNVASYATSSPTESSPTEPLPMEPLLTEPLSTEPLPTDPSATDPSATESLPSIPPTNGTENSVTISAETTIASTNSGLTIETNGDASPSSTLPTAPQTSKPKPSTWAALFKPGTSPNAAGHANAISPTASKSQTASKSAKPPSLNGAPEFTGIAGWYLTSPTIVLNSLIYILNNYETSFQSSLFQPRGLVNNGNICFMNAILQPLSHCPPFYNLVTKIGNRVAHNFKSKTPLLDSFIEFLNEFKIVNESTDFEEYGKPLLPEYVYNALRKRFDSMRGRQEDAEEALGFLLDGLHEEFISVQKKKTEKYVIENIAYEYAQEDNDSAVINGGDAVLEGQNGWLEVGPKNKTSAMRTTEVMESPISRIFGGKVRSVLKCPGTMDSVTLDPFQSFQLDIQPENVHTIEDALANMTVPEMMHDYVSPKGIKVCGSAVLILEGGSHETDSRRNSSTDSGAAPKTIPVRQCGWGAKTAQACQLLNGANNSARFELDNIVGAL